MKFMTVGHNFIMKKISVWAFGVLLAIAAMPAHAQSIQVVASKGDWQIVLSKGSFGKSGGSCLLRSTNKIEGGRRTRPRIRLDLRDSKLFVDPKVYLSGIITAVAVVENRSRHYPPGTVLRHRMRVDGKETIEAQQKDAKYGRWNVHQSVSDFSAFIAQIEGGKRLFYEWTLGRASKSYEFELADFRAMKNLVRTHKKCVEGN